MVAAEIGWQHTRRRVGGDDGLSARQRDDRPELGLGQPRRDHRRRRPELPQREGQLEEGVAVGQRQHDAVALPHALPGERMRAAQAALRQLAQPSTSSPCRTASARPRAARHCARDVAKQQFGQGSALLLAVCCGGHGSPSGGDGAGGNAAAASISAAARRASVIPDPGHNCPLARDPPSR